jgi:hypothetical protein
MNALFVVTAAPLVILLAAFTPQSVVSRIQTKTTAGTTAVS